MSILNGPAHAAGPSLHQLTTPRAAAVAGVLFALPVLFQPIMANFSGSLRLPNGTLNDVVPSLNQSGSHLGQGVASSVAAVAFWAVHMGASRRSNGKAGE